MKKNILLFSIAVIISAISFAQNIGIGNTNPQARLDINGDIILRSHALTVANGTTYALDVNTNKFSNYKLTGTTSNFQIAGITAAANDRNITLYNRTGNSMEIYNDDVNAPASNRILTGTGTTFAVYNGGTVSLRYDTATHKWEVISSHYNNLDYFGSGTGNWDITGSDIYNNNTGNVGIGTSTPAAKFTINGSLALLSDTVAVNCDIMAPTMIIDNIAKNKSIIHIVNNGCSYYMSPSISGINGGTDGKIITIISHVNNMQIRHLQSPNFLPSAADSLNMIELYEPNTNGNINQPYSYTLNNGGTITLMYDVVRNKWKPLSYYGDIKYEIIGWYRGSNANDIYNPNAGNVGIGTGSPLQKLDIAGNAKVRNDFFVDGNVGVGTISPLQKLDIAGNAKVRNNLFIDGNVGIGTTTPTNQLQVVDANTYGGFIKIGANSSAPGWNKKLLFGDGNFVSVGESLIDDQMELTAGNFYFKNNSGTGNVGIGISSPNASLSVLRGTGSDGTAAFFGTTNTSHFNYSTNEDTYIRGGKSTSKLYLNDYGGQVALGTTATGNAQLNIVSSRTGGNANGLSISQTTANAGNYSYGMNVSTSGGTYNYGIKSDATGGGENYAGIFNATGGNGQAGTSNIGVNALAINSNFNYGGKFEASGGEYSFGLYGKATGNANSIISAGVYGESGGNSYAGYFQGNIKVAGVVYCNELIETSDVRLKKNITPLSKSLSSVLLINPVTYNWKDKANDDGLKSGVIAQELQKIYPELVVTQKSGMLGVNYIGLIPHLVKSIQEQQVQIEELKMLVNKLLQTASK